MDVQAPDGGLTALEAAYRDAARAEIEEKVAQGVELTGREPLLARAYGKLDRGEELTCWERFFYSATWEEATWAQEDAEIARQIRAGTYEPCELPGFTPEVEESESVEVDAGTDVVAAMHERLEVAELEFEARSARRALNHEVRPNRRVKARRPSCGMRRGRSRRGRVSRGHARRTATSRDDGDSAPSGQGEPVGRQVARQPTRVLIGGVR